MPTSLPFLKTWRTRRTWPRNHWWRKEPFTYPQDHRIPGSRQISIAHRKQGSYNLATKDMSMLRPSPRTARGRRWVWNNRWTGARPSKVALHTYVSQIKATRWLKSNRRKLCRTSRCRYSKRTSRCSLFHRLINFSRKLTVIFSRDDRIS